MNGQFQGKVALVTGGNSGLGKASALAFAKEGAKVVLSARRAEEGAQVAQLIKDTGGEAFFARADMSEKADIESPDCQDSRGVRSSGLRCQQRRHRGDVIRPDSRLF